MSRGMRLSVLGLYNYDSGLFSEMVWLNVQNWNAYFRIPAQCGQ